MQYKRTTFTFHTDILGKKCMLTELMIYIVPNRSELWTKAIWKLNKYWLSLMASSTSKGEAQKKNCYSVITTCCTIKHSMVMVFLALWGYLTSQQHIAGFPLAFVRAEKYRKMMQLCQLCHLLLFICWAGQKPKYFWNDRVNYFPVLH